MDALTLAAAARRDLPGSVCGGCVAAVGMTRRINPSMRDRPGILKIGRQRESERMEQIARSNADACGFERLGELRP